MTTTAGNITTTTSASSPNNTEAGVLMPAIPSSSWLGTSATPTSGPINRSSTNHPINTLPLPTWSPAWPASTTPIFATSTASIPTTLPPLPWPPQVRWPANSFSQQQSQLPPPNLSFPTTTPTSLFCSSSPYCLSYPVRPAQPPLYSIAHTVDQAQQQADLAQARAQVQSHALALAQAQASVDRLATPYLAPEMSTTAPLPPWSLQQTQLPPLYQAPGMHNNLFSMAGQPSQPAFVVGPGFLPIPHKTVVSVIVGQYVELANLIQLPQEDLSGPVISVDGRIVVSPAVKPPKKITSISQWLQAFAIYSLVMVSYFPGRAIDLLRYQLLILRTAARFSGLAWANYDEAFRRDAAARQLTDWSIMNVELYNFHTAAAAPTEPSSASGGSHLPTTVLVCRSWNRGRCIMGTQPCRYAHRCDTPGCAGTHRRIECPSPARRAVRVPQANQALR